MKILAIDTSCDETAAAIVCGRKIISNVIYSQVLLHKKWGGVMPSVAKRAHQERIDWVIDETLKKAGLTVEEIDAVAVTYGPGLAIALEVGLQKAKNIAKKHNKQFIAVNHMEGHIYSNFAQNRKGNPKRDFAFPYLALLVSGGHTELVLLKDHLTYEILGETRDDAAGESLDKAARMLGFGYPGGPILERLASNVDNVDKYAFPRPMLHSKNLEFSFSGLKTSFLYFLRKMTDEEKVKEVPYLASSFQEAVFQTLVGKTKQAMHETGVKHILVGGGVSVNERLRYLMRAMVEKEEGIILFPPYKYLNFDNAAMIGVAASFKAEKGQFISQIDEVDRVPRLSLLQSSTV
jgi:N6-L-threonylcarbamoyladenine synthase